MNNKAKLPMNKGSLMRAVKLFFEFYPRVAPLTMGCILFSAVVGSIPPLFVQRVIAVIERWYQTGDWAAAKLEIFPMILLLGGLYLLSLCSTVLQTQLMAYMTQGYLDKMRRKLFDGMQDLPISFFDQNKHGDIMSHYTNDIDTLRQLVSGTLPAIIQSGTVVLCVFAIIDVFQHLDDAYTAHRCWSNGICGKEGGRRLCQVLCAPSEGGGCH